MHGTRSWSLALIIRRWEKDPKICNIGDCSKAETLQDLGALCLTVLTIIAVKTQIEVTKTLTTIMLVVVLETLAKKIAIEPMLNRFC